MGSEMCIRDRYNLHLFLFYEVGGCRLPFARSPTDDGKLVLVMSRKPGGVVEGAIRDADKERNYSIRSEEKGGRRGACRVSDSFATQNIRCGMRGCRRYLLLLHSNWVQSLFKTY